MKVGTPPNIENDLFNGFLIERITLTEVGLCHNKTNSNLMMVEARM